VLIVELTKTKKENKTMFYQLRAIITLILIIILVASSLLLLLTGYSSFACLIMILGSISIILIHGDNF